MDNGLRSYAGTGSTGTYYLYDGDQPVCELNAAGTVTAVNTFGNGLLSRWNSSGSSSTFYVFDLDGNVAARVNSGGIQTSSDIYSAFGTREGVGTQPDPWGYGAQEGYYTDTSTGEIYLTRRYYDPGTGRFLSRDPMSYGGGINLYGYCGNGPVDNADPSGMDGGPNQSLLDYYTSGDWGEDTLAVFRGYGQALNSSFNPVAIVNGVGALYQYGRQHGVYAAACMAGSGLYHGFTDWTSTSDPTKFGNSFGNVLIAVASAAAPKASCIIKCFVADTPVQMADGSTKPIEQVKIGDKVISRDPNSGKTERRAVIGTKIHPAIDILKISFADQTGKIVDVIRCTPEHPFYVDGQGFTAAGHLAVGNAIVTRAGPDVTITSIEHEQEETPVSVYNLTIEGDHSYFVGTAGGGEWVHNYDVSAEELTQTQTVAAHTERPYNNSTLTIQEIMDAGDPVPDPQGVPGAQRWDVPGSFMNGATAKAGTVPTNGTWELVINTETKQILHFQFKSW